MPSLSMASTLTSFIGREREIARVSELLAAHRLVTLTGLGGAGKTRLALAVVERAPHDAFDDVVFVLLAPISAAALVAPAIAGALGIRDAERPLRAGIIETIASRRMLLVLDNFEQVLEAGELVSEVLAACPQLTMLVTSRAVLRISGEHVYRVPPLALPDLGQLPPLKQLGTIAAVRLFVERAQAANADFVLTDERAADVAAICARLDGLPLAIELAAARTRMLAPQALLAKLDDQLRLLSGGPRDAPMRQRTLRDTIAWSYDLLPGAARQVFCQLAVFAGGWTLEAAEAVCAIHGDTDVLAGLATLVDHSLVRQRADADGSTRFEMLESLREYGIEQLAAAGELDLTRSRHAVYMLELAERAAPELYGPRQESWFRRLDAEYNNIRAALAHALEHAPMVALRLAGTLGWYWYIRVPFAEGLQWLQAALARTDETAGATRAWALTAEGTLLRELGAFDAAERALDEALRLFDAHGDLAGTVRALDVLAYLWLYRGEHERARPLVNDGLQLARELGDRREIAAHLSGLAVLNWDVALMQQSLALYREVNDVRNIGQMLAHLGMGLLFLSDDAERAETAMLEGLGLARMLADTSAVALQLQGLGYTALARGDAELAGSRFAESLSCELAIGRQSNIPTCCEGLANVALRGGSPDLAARLLGAAEALRERTGEPRFLSHQTRYDRMLAELRTLLPATEFDRAWAFGRGLSIDDAVQLALGPLPTRPPAPVAAFPNGLTAREVDVLRLVAEGLPDAEVAERLFLARRTVNTHLTSIYTKLGVSSRSAATRFAVEHGLT